MTETLMFLGVFVVSVGILVAISAALPGLPSYEEAVEAHLEEHPECAETLEAKIVPTYFHGSDSWGLGGGMVDLTYLSCSTCKTRQQILPIESKAEDTEC